MLREKLRKLARASDSGRPPSILLLGETGTGKGLMAGLLHGTGARHAGPCSEVNRAALTRAKCPDGSLHDRIVKHWTYIRSYVIRDGHLFLALMADGGIYEFEPFVPSKP